MKDTAKRKLSKISQMFLGDFDHRIAVLGAFDTWPYMDYISRLLAGNNYIAVTSRYLYRKINKQIMRFKTQEHSGFAQDYHFMGALLDQIISDCPSAVINFSVSAAHFVETDWCYKKSKKTLGIAYVRAISGFEKESCENLQVAETKNGYYSTCKIKPGEIRTAWDCMKSSSFCPFINQEISKNVIEYFFRGRDMEIVAVEDIRVLPSLLNERYPVIVEDNPKLDNIDDSMARHDEIIFTRDCIFLILKLKSLSKISYMNRLSQMKMLTLLEKTPGWSHSIASNPNKVKYFISRRLGENEIISNLKNGFVDLDLIGSQYTDLARFLAENKYLEVKEITNSNMQGFLIKITKKGNQLAKMYSTL